MVAALEALPSPGCWRETNLLASPVTTVQGQAGLLASQGGLHFPARAKRVVQFYMSGAASHVDMFDYKPMLEKYHGQPFMQGKKIELFQSAPGSTMKSPWGWKQYGQIRQVDQRYRFPVRRLRGRHGLRPLHDVQEQRSRPRHAHAGDGICPAWISQHGLLGQLRAWAARTTTCRRLSCFPIAAASLPPARRTGARGFCPLSIRAP